MNIIEHIKEKIVSLFIINKFQTIFSLVSIVCSVGVLISVSAVSEGHKRFTISEIEKMGVNIIEIFSIPKKISLSDVETIRKMHEIKDAIPKILGEFIIQELGKENRYILVEGTLPCSKEMINLPMEKGRFFTQQEVDSIANVCVIGSELHKKLFAQKDIIGKKIHLVGNGGKKTQLTIIGVLKEMGTLKATLIDNEGIIVPITVFKSQLKDEKYLTSIIAQVNNYHQIKKVVTKIKKIFELKHIKLRIGTQDDLISDTIKMHKKITTIGHIIGIIFLIVGGINIMGIQLKSLTERLKEIGIRRSIGAKRRDIVIHFVSEATIVGIIGGLIGILLGISGPFLIFRVMDMGGNPIFSFWIIVISFSCALIIGVLSSLYPAYKASYVNPVEVLKNE